MTSNKYEHELSTALSAFFESLAGELGADADPAKMDKTNAAIDKTAAVLTAAGAEAKRTLLTSRLTALTDTQSTLARRERRLSGLLSAIGDAPKPGKNRAALTVRVLSGSTGAPLPGVPVALVADRTEESTLPVVTTNDVGTAIWAFDAETLSEIGETRLRPIVRAESGESIVATGDAVQLQAGVSSRIELSAPAGKLPAAQARADHLAASLKTRASRYAGRRAELGTRADLATFTMAGGAEVVRPDVSTLTDRRLDYGVRSPLASIEGVGPQYTARLEAVGVRDIVDLVRLAGTPERRAELAERSGVGERQLEKWVVSADLQRVDGIDRHAAELLRESGVESVEALANVEPAALRRRASTTNTRLEIVEELPSLETLEAWRVAASKLARPTD